MKLLVILPHPGTWEDIPFTRLAFSWTRPSFCLAPHIHDSGSKLTGESHRAFDDKINPRLGRSSFFGLFLPEASHDAGQQRVY
jgi:hypothetical protein